ncbi:MAG TPA: hypothetical protein VME46_23250 [Acidimicrobiales bacterium]|nr:hypothetical protein [Acidimicrobiales bacterium]
MNWQGKVTEALGLVVAIAIVARVVSGLLDPLLPTLIALAMIGALIAFALRRR